MKIKERRDHQPLQKQVSVSQTTQGSDLSVGVVTVHPGTGGWIFYDRKENFR